MKCPKCGNDIANDSNFCEYCGNNIHKKHIHKALLGLFTVIIVIIIIGIMTSTGTLFGEKVTKIEEELDINNKDYIDLGLPSGTIWAIYNEDNLYDYDYALSEFGKKLPTKEQWEELKNVCKWVWTGSEYRLTGPNGNSIVLPAAGYRSCSGSVNNVGSNGNYWSSTPSGSEKAWNLVFDSDRVFMNINKCCNGRSVRLVRN